MRVKVCSDLARLAALGRWLPVNAGNAVAACRIGRPAGRVAAEAERQRARSHCAQSFRFFRPHFSLPQHQSYASVHATGEKTLPGKLFITSASALLLPSLDGSIDAFSASGSSSVPQ